MTDFHPWTLRAQDSTHHVPYIGSLRPADMSREESMSHWFVGNLLSLESSRYVSNVLSVFRMRPMDEDDKANSDNECEDDELLFNPEDSKNALNTKKRGRRSEHKIDALPNANGRLSHEDNSRLGPDWALQAWQQEAISTNAIVTLPDAPVRDPTIVLASARVSQNKERSFHDS